MLRANKVLGALVVVEIAILAGLLSGCSEPDFTESPRARPDAGVPVVRDPMPPQVDLSPSAIIGSGMRSCFVSPEQQNGEFAIGKYTDNSLNIQTCLILASTGSWDVCSPEMHWYNGEVLNDNIRRISGNVPAGYCMRIRLYQDWMYGGGVYYDNKWCKAPWESGVLPFYAHVLPYASSIRTNYFSCNTAQWQQGCPAP